MPGVIPSAEFNAQLVKTVQAEMRRLTHEQPTGVQTRHNRESRQVGFLAGTLAAASDPRLAWSSQPSATVNVYSVDNDGVMTDSGTTLTVFSKRDVSFEADTYVECIFTQGKWQLRDANCAATAL